MTMRLEIVGQDIAEILAKIGIGAIRVPIKSAPLVASSPAAASDRAPDAASPAVVDPAAAGTFAETVAPPTRRGRKPKEAAPVVEEAEPVADIVDEHGLADALPIPDDNAMTEAQFRTLAIGLVNKVPAQQAAAILKMNEVVKTFGFTSMTDACAHPEAYAALIAKLESVLG
jgi:hypothetical protein